MHTDRYGRIVAIVAFANQSINARMIETGYAWIYDKYCRVKKLCNSWRKLEHAAQIHERDLWANKDAMPPWV